MYFNILTLCHELQKMNREIVAYNIVGGFNSDELVKNVEEKMKDGWQPLESPFLIGDEVVQAIVKYREIPIIDENRN